MPTSNTAGMPYQPNPVLASLTRIGQIDYFNMPSLGQYVDYDDGYGNLNVYLRSGMFAPAADYPIAARLRHLWAVGTPMGLPASTAYTGIAMNDVGGIVAAFGDATNVHVSLDYGATWSVVAHNAGGVIRDVVWNASNGLFITCGNTAILQLTSSSPTGAVFTARTGATLVGCAADSMRAVVAGGTTVMAAATGTVAVGSSTNGTTWTARTLSQAVTTLALIAHNGTNYLVAGTGGTAGCTSTDGTTWSNATMPTASPSQLGGITGRFAIMTGTGGQAWTSTTGATGAWTPAGATTFPNVGQSATTTINATANCGLRTFGGRFNFVNEVSTNEWISTTDFRTYTRKGISSNPQSSMIHGSSDSSNVVILPLSASLQGGYSTKGTAADNVGIVASFSSTANTTERLYVRIA